MVKKKILLLSGDESYLVDASKDFNSRSGLIKAKDMKVGNKVKTHIGKQFVAIKPTIKDIIEKGVKRTAQVILPKDISLILGYTGVSNDSLVVDAGTGSGYAAIFLSNYISNGKIVTYENDKRFVAIARKNIENAGCRNVELRQKDITKGIKERNVGLIVLDLQKADKVIKHAYKSLIYGGYLVVYSPTIEHLMKAIKKLKRERFIDIKTIENIVREWQSERTLRPKTIGLMHTGFLTFARKVG